MSLVDEFHSLGRNVLRIGVVVFGEDSVFHLQSQDGMGKQDDGGDDESTPLPEDSVQEEEDRESKTGHVHGPEVKLLGTVQTETTHDETGNTSG